MADEQTYVGDQMEDMEAVHAVLKSMPDTVLKLFNAIATERSMVQREIENLGNLIAKQVERREALLCAETEIIRAWGRIPKAADDGR